MTAHGVDLDALTLDQRTALVEELFDDEKRNAIKVAETLGYEAGYEAGVVADGDYEPHRDPTNLVEALHAWHDAYHDGAFRLCREPQCRDFGFGTSGPAPTLLAPTLLAAS